MKKATGHFYLLEPDEPELIIPRKNHEQIAKMTHEAFMRCRYLLEDDNNSNK